MEALKTKEEQVEKIQQNESDIKLAYGVDEKPQIHTKTKKTFHSPKLMHNYFYPRE